MTDIVSPTIERLRGQVAAFSNRVAGAAEVAVVAESYGADLTVPHAFVVYAGETAEPIQTAGTGAGAGVQVVDLGFAVLVCIDNSADRRGAAATDSVFTLRASILSALLGWTPVSGVCLSPCEYRGSEFVDMNRGRLWHQFNFSVLTTVAAD